MTYSYSIGSIVYRFNDLKDLLAKPNPCVITAVRTDGQPVSVATWYLLEGDRILVNMDEGRKRLLWGVGLALLYILLACWFFTRVYRYAVRTGLIARYSAESVS